jgi:hypothetical protein
VVGWLVVGGLIQSGQKKVRSALIKQLERRYIEIKRSPILFCNFPTFSPDQKYGRKRESTKGSFFFSAIFRQRQIVRMMSHESQSAREKCPDGSPNAEDKNRSQIYISLCQTFQELEVSNKNNIIYEMKLFRLGDMRYRKSSNLPFQDDAFPTSKKSNLNCLLLWFLPFFFLGNQKFQRIRLAINCSSDSLKSL